jgi:aminomethyltransferase
MQTLLRTPLYDRHVAVGARLVPFAGWEMPVQYEGVIQEHLAVRNDCGVFDVSHMGELEVEGPGAREFLQAALSNDLDRIGPDQAQYTLLTNEQGGIVDDLIVYERGPESFLLIVNASNREADFRWLQERESPGAEVRDVSDAYALLAVQGPRSLERLGLPEAPAFTFAEGKIDGVPCTVNRTGYTGEVGVELLVSAESGGELWDRVLERGAVPCGLGARDTLRLEVCYPLHGNDIGPDTDAISAGLGWVCALEKDFTGAAELRRAKEQGPARRLAAFVMDEPGIPRQGMSILGDDGDSIGEVTSGSHSPMLDRGIGLGYVTAQLAQPDTPLTIDIRGRARRARVVKKPIYSREERNGG